MNTEHLHFKAYQNMLENNGASFPWDFPSFAAVAHKSSDGLRKLITAHAPDLTQSKPWETLYDEKKSAYAKLLEEENLSLMPGAQTVLERVQTANIPHSVVTNSTRKQIEMIREKIPALHQIPYWITREDYENPKPSPDAYLKAIKTLGTSDKMLGFEDSLRGIRSLKGAGITPVLICSSDHPQMSDIPKGSLYYYPSFTQLLKTAKKSTV